MKTISNLARTSQGHIFFCYKVKSHAGIAGNECTDKVVNFQASLKDNNLTDTSIPSAGPGGNPFYNTAWLAREEARLSTPEFSLPIPNLRYFPVLEDALKCHIHVTHRLVCYKVHHGGMAMLLGQIVRKQNTHLQKKARKRSRRKFQTKELP
eukprot:1161118-Pelagomonas_calceolata.AAC.2